MKTARDVLALMESGKISDEDLAREYAAAIKKHKDNPGAMVAELMHVLTANYHLSMQDIQALLPKFSLLNQMAKDLKL